jgi:hypothetical protein
MGELRRSLTVRIVPLGAERSHDVAAGTTVAQRLALLAELSREGWALSGKPVPQYARSKIPVRVVPLRRMPQPRRGL